MTMIKSVEIQSGFLEDIVFDIENAGMVTDIHVETDGMVEKLVRIHQNEEIPLNDDDERVMCEAGDKIVVSVRSTGSGASATVRIDYIDHATMPAPAPSHQMTKDELLEAVQNHPERAAIIDELVFRDSGEAPLGNGSGFFESMGG